MDTVAETLAAEQQYFDFASSHRERMRGNLRQAAGAAANAGAATRIRKDTDARLERIGSPDDPVAFGRMDDEDGDVLYLGHHSIFNDESDVVVVNWQAPAAARFYAASHTDPRGLRMRRSFDCTGNTVNSFSDVVFQQLAAAVAELEGPDDALLNDLERDRTGQMQDIVKTIQAAQYELIRAPLDQLLVIQGGPGTGKTAVALHRVSWLLFNHLDTLSADDVLIVGPNPTFTRYTRMVLPSLGDTSVVQRDIGQLRPAAKRGRVEDPDVIRLKGEARMAGLLRRGLYDRVGMPAGQRRLEIQIGRRTVAFSGDEVTGLVTKSRSTSGTFSERRQIFRDLMVNFATDRLRGNREGLRPGVEQLVERVWPSFTAASFLRDLFGSRDRLIAAAGDEFTARDVASLHRRSSERLSDEVWSDADLALLDEADALINGVSQRFSHIVVDEAQDLSPMQLRCIARRSSTGSMTVVGDLAQSTGPWARDGWDDVLDHLPSQLPHHREDLRYGYRVPRQVFELAERLLPQAAPDLPAPLIVRDGPANPVITEVSEGDRAATAVRAAMDHAAHGRSVAIICPASHRWDIESELALRDVAWRAASGGDLGQGVNLVSPQEAKGLEFDAVIVVEPEAIIAEDERGHRLLYVALTRTTRYLHVVGVRPTISNDDAASEPESRIPAQEPPSQEQVGQSPQLPVPAPAPGAATITQEPTQAVLTLPGGLAAQIVELAATELVRQIRDGVPPAHWKAVLDRAAELLADA